VRHRAGRRNREQELAYEHEDVVSLVGEIVSSPDLRLVKLAQKVTLIRHELDHDEVYSLIGPILWDDDELGEVAQRVVASAHRIGTASNRDARVRRRGAFLERLVFELVDARKPGVTHLEHEVELTRSPRSRRQWTNPKEVVVADQPFEVYECKADGMVDVGDVDELSDVVTTGAAEGVEARAVVVTLGTELEMRRRSVVWRLTEPIHGVTIERILDLRVDSPMRPIVPAA
jgi:hypothetical protein